MKLFRRGLTWVLALLGLALAAASYLGFLSGTVDALASLLPFGILAAALALLLSIFDQRSILPLVCAIFALLLAAGRVVPEWLAQPPTSREGVRIVIETHNMARGGLDPERQIRALAASGADILLLQEQRGGGARVTAALAGLYPYRDSCGRCELAILSRLPISRVHWRLRDRDGHYIGPPLFRAEVTLPGGGTIEVLTLHQTWPLPPEAQARERAALIDAIRQTPSDRMVLAGDFNLTPWGAGMRQLDAGLQPMARITRAHFSFPARIGRQYWPLPWLPIDQIFVGRQVTVERIETMPATGSDHFPIRATLHVTPDRSGETAR